MDENKIVLQVKKQAEKKLYIYMFIHAQLLQFCLTLCDPMDSSLPVSAVDFSGKNTVMGCHALQGIL